AVSLAGLVDHFLAIEAEVVTIDAGEQLLVFALFEIENVQDVPRRVVLVGALGADLLRLLLEEHLAFAHHQVAVDASRNRSGGDALFDSVEVDLDGLGRLFLFLVFLFVLSGVVFFRRIFVLAGFFILLAGISLLIFLIFVFVLVGALLFVTLGFERRFLVTLEGQGEYAVRGVVAEALVKLAGAGEEVALRQKEDVLAVGIEDRVGVAVIAVGDLRGLFLLERIEVHLSGLAPIGLGVDDPGAVGRPIAVGNVAVIAFINLHGF